MNFRTSKPDSRAFVQLLSNEGAQAPRGSAIDRAARAGTEPKAMPKAKAGAAPRQKPSAVEGEKPSARTHVVVGRQAVAFHLAVQNQTLASTLKKIEQTRSLRQYDKTKQVPRGGGKTLLDGRILLVNPEPRQPTTWSRSTYRMSQWACMPQPLARGLRASPPPPQAYVRFRKHWISVDQVMRMPEVRAFFRQTREIARRHARAQARRPQAKPSSRPLRDAFRKRPAKPTTNPLRPIRHTQPASWQAMCVQAYRQGETFTVPPVGKSGFPEWTVPAKPGPGRKR